LKFALCPAGTGLADGNPATVINLFKDMRNKRVYGWANFGLLGFGSPWSRQATCTEWLTDEGVTVIPKVRMQCIIVRLEV
jgi:hypothetical protein